MLERAWASEPTPALDLYTYDDRASAEKQGRILAAGRGPPG